MSVTSSAFEIQEQPDADPNAPVPADADADLEQIQHDPNASNFRKFVASVKLRGRQSARGKDSLPNLVGDIASAVSDGAITNVKEKQRHPKDASKEISLAEYIFVTYTEEEGKKAVHNRSPGSYKSQVSKIQQVITASNKPLPASFKSVLERARLDILPKLKQTEAKLWPAFDAYVSLARAQQKVDHISDADIEKAWIKSANGDPNTVSKQLAKAHRVLKKLLGGEAKDGVRVDQSDPQRADLEAMMHDLLGIIRTYDPDYDVPKAGTAPAQPTNGEDAEANGDEELLTETNEQVEEGTLPAPAEEQGNQPTT